MGVKSGKQGNYFRQLIVPVNVSTVYQALTKEIGMWWTQPEGDAHKIGDTPIFRFDDDLTHWKMKVINLIPDKLVQWECVDAHHITSNLSVTDEWLGTKLQWDLKSLNGQTEISFLHEGLNSNLECFDMCVQGWDFFFVDKLNGYLTSPKK